MSAFETIKAAYAVGRNDPSVLFGHGSSHQLERSGGQFAARPPKVSFNDQGWFQFISQRAEGIDALEGSPVFRSRIHAAP